MLKVYNDERENVKVIFLNEKFVCVLKDENRNFQICELFQHTQNLIIKYNINEILDFDYLNSIFQNLNENSFNEYFLYDKVYSNLTYDVKSELISILESDVEKNIYASDYNYERYLNLINFNNFLIKVLKSYISFL